jgi:poly(3-hydroxybutyrate) depolymerase
MRMQTGRNRTVRRVLGAVSVLACALTGAGAGAGSAQATTGLAHYDITADYVSGISSGADEAVQFQVAYSARFQGLAFFGGAPYDCAQDSSLIAEEACSEDVLPDNLSALYSTTNTWASQGLIDPTSNLSGKPVYEWHGTLDPVVAAPVAGDAATYLRHYGANVTYVNNVASGHGWISPLGPVACSLTVTPYINNCGLNPEQSFLSLWLGLVSPPNTGPLGGQMIEFDQNQYAPGDDAASVGLASDGYEYVPSSCASGAACRLVLALHGCTMSAADIGDAFIDDTYLNQYADTNNLVVLYPQVSTTDLTANPQGCWDWWGYLPGDANYAQKSGAQMSAVMSMITANGG